MTKISLILSLVLSFNPGLVNSQTFDIVIKDGHVIDPKNNIDEIMDVAISNGKIARVAKSIDSANAGLVIHARDMYITPGLIDIHSHNFYGNHPDQSVMDGMEAVVPDGFTFRSGVTTVVDAGSSGWRSFFLFKERIIDRSQTRVLAFLNIVGAGMRGDPYEQNVNDMDPKLSALTAKAYKNIIVGFKVAHYQGHEWLPVDRAVEAGTMAGSIPVMVDFGVSIPPLSLEELLMKHLRPGDILTHCFAQFASRESIVDLKTNKLKNFIADAAKKGIVFDVGHGASSFMFSQANPAIKNGFYPNTISTDLHTGSMNSAMKDMLTTMSKFVAMGMDLKSVIAASTWNPAKVIRHEELGTLSIGSDADVAVLNIRKGKFGLFDYTGVKIVATKKIECEMTIRGGKIVYDLNGMAYPEASRKGK